MLNFGVVSFEQEPSTARYSGALSYSNGSLCSAWSSVSSASEGHFSLVSKLAKSGNTVGGAVTVASVMNDTYGSFGVVPSLNHLPFCLYGCLVSGWSCNSCKPFQSNVRVASVADVGWYFWVFIMESLVPSLFVSTVGLSFDGQCLNGERKIS